MKSTATNKATCRGRFGNSKNRIPPVVDTHLKNPNIMKSTRLIILMFLIAFYTKNVSAQTEIPEYRRLVENFVHFYNSNQADSVYNLFAPEMKDAIPIDKTQAMVAGLKHQLGDIVSIDFIRYQSTVGIYKTKFNSGTVAMNISINEAMKIDGLFFKPYIPDTIPVMERNTTKLILPFEREWDVFWGGDTKENNYHVAVQSQKNAFDFLIQDKTGKSFKNNGQSNEDFYCFGENILSPCDAEAVMVIDGVKDNIPGEMNSFFATGNTVVLKTKNNEYIYLCHFKKHTIRVKEGQQVKQGKLLGLCGNSGNSSEAHLHFHLQNVENMNIATGMKCYFDNILVNGEPKSDYSPLKGEKIKN